MADRARPAHAGQGWLDGRSGAALGTHLAILALFTAVAVNRYGIRIGETHLRLELIVAAAGLVIGLARLDLGAFGPRRDRAQREPFVAWRGSPLAQLRDLALQPEEWWLGAWIGINVLSSLTASPRPLGSLKLAFLLALLAGLYGLIRRLLSKEGAVVFALRAWLLVGGAVEISSVLAVLSFHAFGATAGLDMEATYPGGRAQAALMVRATLWEPNVLGSYCATVALLALGLAISPAGASVAGRGTSIAVLSLSSCGVVLSASRGAMLALVAGAFLLVAFSARDRVGAERTRKPWIPLAGCLAGAALGGALAMSLPRLILPGSPSREAARASALRTLRESQTDGAPTGTDPTTHVSAPLLGRLRELRSPFTAHNLRQRLIIWRWAVRQWLTRPWLGWGTGASRYLALPGGSTGPVPSDRTWIGNLELHLLFDSGVAGVLAFFAAVGIVVRRACRVLRAGSKTPAASSTALPGLLAGLAALGVAFQATEATWLGFPWVFLGILSAVTRHGTEAAHRMHEPRRGSSRWLRRAYARDTPDGSMQVLEPPPPVERALPTVKHPTNRLES